MHLCQYTNKEYITAQERPELSELIKTCWVISSGIAGTENQAVGIAEALGIHPVIKRIKLKAPWRQLSPWLTLGHARALAADSDPIEAPWPDLVIASGRQSIGIARHVREKSKGHTFTVQVQDPRVDPHQFDLVIVPQHDPTRGDNVIVTKASTHRVTKQQLAAAAVKFAPDFEKIPHPRVGVLIGGNSKTHRMTPDNTRMLAEMLMGLVDHRETGLLVTCSRRTGPDNEAMLRKMLDHPQIFFWDGQGENPYFGLLALSDYIVVTEDSVSMTSEALSTGKPVYIASMEGGAARHDQFHRMLEDQGYTRPFTGMLEKWSYTPPDDTHYVAAEIRQRMKARAWNARQA